MKKRLQEIEEEAGALREMQAKVEKEMGATQGLFAYLSAAHLVTCYLCGFIVTSDLIFCLFGFFICIFLQLGLCQKEIACIVFSRNLKDNKGELRLLQICKLVTGFI